MILAAALWSRHEWAWTGFGVKILWIPHTGWNIPQRAHLFCRELALRHQVHVTDWVADFSGWRDYLSAKHLQNYRYTVRTDGRVRVHRIPRFSPAVYSASLRRLNDTIFTGYVKKIIARWEIDVVVGTFVVVPPRAPRLIFDLFDENVDGWRTANPAYAREIQSKETAYLRHADAVVAASTVLLEKAQRLGVQAPLHWIPNGVDLRLFNRPPNHRPADQNGIVIGVVGNFEGRDQLDRVLRLAELVRQKPWNFVVAGGGTSVSWAVRQAHSRRLTNLDFLGPVPHDRLPEILAGFDVGLCPYANTPMDNARSPMRLLDYTAAGLPTVCTCLEEVRRMGFLNVVLVQDSPSALAAGIQRALKLPRSRPPQLHGYHLPILVSRYEAVLAGH